MTDLVGVAALIVAAVAALAAVSSAVSAARSARTARRALGFQKAAAIANEPSLTVRLIDSWRRQDAEAGWRVYAFHLLLINDSAAANSIPRAELRVTYRRPSGDVAYTGVLPHDPSRSQDMLGLVDETLVIPCDLPPRGSRSVWAVFGMQAEKIREVEVDAYEVLLYDARDEPTAVRPLIVKDIEIAGLDET